MIVSNADPSLLIVKASAGSGKTFNLAVEYITKAISNGGDFRQILAVTFTNKATREMKERITLFLKSLSHETDENLVNILEDKTGLDRKEIQKRSSLVLKRILHNYSHFAVTTIDSFNQKILRAFTREIGLIGNFNLELDTRKIVEIGVDLVLDSSSEKKNIRKWLLEFIKDKLQQGKSWDIKRDLKSLALELYSEAFKLIESLNYQLPTAEKLSGYVEMLRNIKHSYEIQMRKFGVQAGEIATRFDLTVADFKYGRAGAFNYFTKIVNNPSDSVPGKRVLECIENSDNWYTKNSVKKEEIISALSGGLQDVLINTVSYYEENYTTYTTADSILRNIYTLGLFSEIKNAIDNYKRDNDLFLLSDTNIFLKGIIGENEAPFIYEKSGSWYRNFLIDEFQDTSRLQWSNFKPLIENSLAEGQSNLIVGDAKQSIYRWRGGDWELMEKEILHDIATNYLRSTTLEVNWRSSPEVVAFNNAVFRTLPTVFRDAFESISKTEKSFGNDFNLIYEESEQQVAGTNKGKSGYVKIDFSPKEENKKEWKEAALQWLKQNIDFLLDHGWSPGSMAVLTRTKKEGTEVVNFLHEQKSVTGNSYEVISNESLLLQNFPAIRLLINSLKFINNPESHLALANVAVEYFYTNNSAETLNDLLSRVTLKDELTSFFPEGFLSNIEFFRKHGLIEAIAEIINIFQLDTLPENTVCLISFQDIALNFIHENTNDIGAFIQWWEEEGDRQTLKSPENINAIQVMTIHKSKGLEFDNVLIPFMNWDTDHNATNDVFIWCKNEVEPFSEVPVVPLRYQSRLSESLFIEDYFNEKHKAYIDNLNLCYVAFTRAKQALFLHGELPPANKNKNKKTFCVSDLIYDTMQTEQFVLREFFDKAAERFEMGTLKKKIQTTFPKTPSTYLFIQNAWSEKAELKRRGRDLLKKNQEERKQKINYGLLVHEILAEIKNLDELDLLITRYYSDGVISSEEVKILRDQLDRVLANPEVIKWFHTSWAVKTESAILSKDSGELRPDRVMTRGKEAVLVDFKTGKEEPQHVKQLIRYRNKLIEMGYQTVNAYLLYIASNRVKQIM